MYADKQKAKRGEYRIREKTLWKVALIGGALGSTLGMTTLHHKNRHTNFRYGFPTLAILESLCVVYISIRFS
ncbi:DUF1294 domain-containing protein [Aneurinibacillus sp. Ricciae_BoGa-3]|nr:DUF1294 domain-containing protein [Aneurinibacillus sp. Ricciae_BoGa-3]WCK56864.1 DUF1294 domain-containing protein [Aneurinibacillus sp. Ricciae_BoGa-3]